MGKQKSIVYPIAILYIFGLVFLIFPCPGLNAQYGKWHRDTSFHDIEFKRIRFQEGNEKLYAQGILKQKTIVDGYPCYKEITMTKEN